MSFFCCSLAKLAQSMAADVRFILKGPWQPADQRLRPASCRKRLCWCFLWGESPCFARQLSQRLVCLLWSFSGPVFFVFWSSYRCCSPKSPFANFPFTQSSSVFQSARSFQFILTFLPLCAVLTLAAGVLPTNIPTTVKTSFLFGAHIVFWLRFKRSRHTKLQLHSPTLFWNIFCRCVLCVVCGFVSASSGVKWVTVSLLFVI